MATTPNTTKTTTAKTAPKPAAPAAKSATAPKTTETPAETKDRKPNGATSGLFGSLVGGAKTVDEMPTLTRNGSSRANPFAKLVKETYDSGKPSQVGPVAENVKDTVVAAIRRGAAKENLGVNVVTEPATDDEGNVIKGEVVITFKGKEKAIR